MLKIRSIVTAISLWLFPVNEKARYNRRRYAVNQLIEQAEDNIDYQIAEDAINQFAEMYPDDDMVNWFKDHLKDQKTIKKMARLNKERV